MHSMRRRSVSDEGAQRVSSDENEVAQAPFISKDNQDPLVRLHSGNVSEGVADASSKLVIRKYANSDRDEVLDVCLRHYKSLSLPSVRHYCANHTVEIVVLMAMGLFQTTILNVFLNFLVFGLYLYFRAWWELRSYCRYNCTDIEDVAGYYKKNNTCFFVAELDGSVVGCGGLRPSRFHGPEDGQIIRLVVDSSARRLRIGTRLLNSMETFAKSAEYERICIKTSDLTKAHMNFLSLNGYSMTARISRNAMRGDLLKWRKDLTAPSEADALPEIDEQYFC